MHNSNAQFQPTQTAKRPGVMTEVRRRYTDPAAMLAHLESLRPGRRYLEALRCRGIAVRPAGRFDLRASDTALVVPVLDAVITLCRAVLAPAGARVREMYRERLSPDEIAGALNAEFPDLIAGDVPAEVLAKIKSRLT